MSTTINLTIIIQQPATPDPIGAAAAAAPAPASAMDQLAYKVARFTAQKRRQAPSQAGQDTHRRQDDERTAIPIGTQIYPGRTVEIDSDIRRSTT